MDVNVEEIRNAMLELEALKARKEAIKQKALEHRDTITDAEIETQKAEVLKINADIEECEKRIKNLEKQERTINMENVIDFSKIREERANAFVASQRTKLNALEVRSTILSSGGIVKPTKVSGIIDGFPTAISIVDQVYTEDMTGVGTHKVSYQDSMQEASEKTDGTAQDESDPVFKSVTITPFLLATTSYVSRELRKQTPVKYFEKVVSNALSALKVKLAEWILNGVSGKFKGIKTSVNDDEVAVNMFKAYDVTANTVDADFLRKLVLNYGGDANVYGGSSVLYLNKADLIALGSVRGANEKKPLYEIVPDSDNPNTGVIKEGGLIVRYCICPKLTALTTSTVPTDTSTIKTMIYGNPLNYELDLFGDYEISTSVDYKFAEGLITVMGEVMVGGSIIVPDGFSVVTLKKAA